MAGCSVFARGGVSPTGVCLESTRYERNDVVSVGNVLAQHHTMNSPCIMAKLIVWCFEDISYTIRSGAYGFL